MIFNTMVWFSGGDVYVTAIYNLMSLSLIVLFESCVPALDKAENPIQKLLVKLKSWVFSNVVFFGLFYLMDLSEWPQLASLKYLFPLLACSFLLCGIIFNDFVECLKFWRHGTDQKVWLSNKNVSMLHYTLIYMMVIVDLASRKCKSVFFFLILNVLCYEEWGNGCFIEK